MQLAIPGVDHDTKNVSHVGAAKPWETWPLRYDLEGRALRSPFLLEGDDRVQRGDYHGALELYLKAPTAAMNASEKEATMLRVVGANIAIGNGREALRTLSSHFIKSGRSSEEVDARSSLLFAYAYRTQGDTEQALAWFSRVYRAAGSNAVLADAARRGAIDTIQSLPSEVFAKIVPLWESDSLMRGLLAEEMRRRTDGGEAIALTRSTHLPQVESSPGAAMAFAALLPLSGKFERLGRSSRQGMELAFQSFPQRHGLEIKFLDTGDDVDQAVGQALAASADPAVALVIGPLIAEHAHAVRQVLDEKDIPLIALSKSSDFHPGGRAFRFGPTVRSQVESLLQGVMAVRQLKRFALIYPADVAGEEYATAFRELVAQSGGSVVYEKGYTRGNETDLLVAAQELELTTAEAVFMPDTVVRASRLFSNLSREARRRITPIGVVLWDELQALNQSRAVMNGAVVVSAFNASGSGEQTQRFVALYREKYGEPPDFLAAQGFDIASVLLAALGPGADTGRSVERALLEAPILYGLTGRIAVQGDGEVSRTFEVLEYRDGAFKALEPEVDPMLADLPSAAPSEIAAPAQESKGLAAREDALSWTPATVGASKR